MEDRTETTAAHDRQPALSLQEKVLASGMLYGRGGVGDFVVTPDGNRIHNQTLNAHEFTALVKEFKTNPYARLATARNNLLSIMKDERLSLETRNDRVKRYTDAYLDLILKLDHQAFPPEERVHRGIPDYIP